MKSIPLSPRLIAAHLTRSQLAGPSLAELVLAGINRMRHFRNQHRRFLPTMIAFDVLSLSDTDIDQLSKQMRWQVIDAIEQRIDAARELEQVLSQRNFTYSLTDEIRDLKAMKIRFMGFPVSEVQEPDLAGI